MAKASGARAGQGDETGPFGSDYNVFLSFRGPDTRLGITDVLYEFMTEKGIRVLRDDEEMRRGEEIGRELKRAIRCSRVYVVVFSRGYASSAWCLRELAMMVDCCRDSVSGKVILPIFFDVDPQDVKLRTDLYRGALDKHRGRCGEERVERWEEALMKVGGISGWDYKGDMGEGKFARFVVHNVLRYLKVRDRSLPLYLVGMDDLVERVMTMLNCESPDVRVVMLHGMGGIGKTTLANAIFNEISSQFDGCSFLANVRESSTGEGGVIKLQKKLLGDILGILDTEIDDSNDGKNQINRSLRGKSVLIILDDLSERGQLNELVGTCDFFGLGTRIIITTRDRSVCKGLSRNNVVYTYEMEVLRDDCALQLFNWHAFGCKGPQDDFVALSKQVIRTMGNLPLALEVIGGHLFGENKNVWESTLEKLKGVPDEGVVKILRISYDNLGEREKQIFLDIACFEHDAMPRKYASYMWEACGFYPKCGLDVLQNRSLIKVLNVDGDDEDEYWMHDLIREMGREIVRSEGILLHSPGTRSRLWDPKEAINVVRLKQGTDQVLAIDLGFLWDEHGLTTNEGIITGEEFEGMSSLRFLKLRAKSPLIGDFRHFPTKLLWLRWEGSAFGERGSIPCFFEMDNLVILQISEITDKSLSDMRMGNLRVLDIKFAKITRMPDLSRCSKLEIIILKNCNELEELHSSIGVLGVLKCLKIEYCSRLRRLPEEIASAKALQELSLIASGMQELPESIGSLEDLRILRGDMISIRKLPSSIGNLKSLEVLEIERCFPGRFTTEVPKFERCDLSGLSCLRSFSLCGLIDLEELLGIEKLHGLQKLKLDVVGKPVLLSAELGSLSRLEELRMRYWDISSISQLPSSLRRLTLVGYPIEDLSRLMLSETWLDGLDNMVNLSNLILEGCMDVKLSDFASLRRLCSLRLDLCERVDFSGAERMELLEELIIHRCRYFPRGIPDLSKLRRLKRMEFVHCYDLQSMPRVVGECRLKVCACGELDSFEGTYRQYQNKKRRQS